MVTYKICSIFIIYCTVFFVCSNAENTKKDTGYLTLFHDPPKPLAIWQDPYPMPETFQRPITWKAKNFGQWCRNFTINIQCPEASPFHWYVCCGEHNVQCCGGVQTWTYVVFGSLIVSAIIIFVFFILLHFNLIFYLPEEIKKKVSTRKNSATTNHLIGSSTCSSLSTSTSMIQHSGSPPSASLLFDKNKTTDLIVKPYKFADIA